MSVSKTVDDRVKVLYARLATAAAKKAIGRIEYHNDEAGAEQWAKAANKWLVKAGAAAARWEFVQPKVPS